VIGWAEDSHYLAVGSMLGYVAAERAFSFAGVADDAARVRFSFSDCWQSYWDEVSFEGVASAAFPDRIA